MPELPEVEVTRLGIIDTLVGNVIEDLFISDKQLREPIDLRVKDTIGYKVNDVQRRGKYLIICTDNGNILLHLGMSGHLKVLDANTEYKKHDHFSIKLSNHKEIRLNDTRRFGLVSFIPKNMDILLDKHLSILGPEPFSDEFTGKYLFEKLQKRTISVKACIMDSKVVVGVGNIYASESLFLSKINPQKSACKITLKQANELCMHIKEILKRSIAQGGTTLKDFSGADGKMGYFVQRLNVYGHEGKPCPICSSIIKSVVISGRNTFYCPKCQK